MKASLRVRIASLIAAGGITFALVEAMALLGHPAPDDATRLAAAVATKPVR